MNTKPLFAFLTLLILAPKAEAAIHSCEEWKQKLPAKYAKDLRAEGDSPATYKGVAMACANQVGTYALSYAINRGKNALILELAAKVGVSGSTVSFVMVGGHQVLLAWKAAQFMYAALEADKACYENHELKRGMLEPVAHFYPDSVIENWVRNIGCTEIGRQVHLKVQALDATLAEKARKQKDWELRTNPERRLSPEQLRQYERMYPAESRELTDAEKIYAQKRAAMARPIPLLDVATDLMPCLKPEAIARMACGFVAETALRYSSRNFDVRNVGLEPELKRVLESVVSKLPATPRR